MGMMDKFLNAMKLNVDDEEYYDDEFYDDVDDYYGEEPVRQERPARTSRLSRSSAPAREDRFEDQTASSSAARGGSRSSSKITPMRSNRKMPSGTGGMEVCVIKPKSVDDAREICETLLEHRTVILNLEGLDLEIGQRIIDFTSGSCFAVSGSLQKVSNYIFIVTPNNVDISGDFQSLVSAFDVSSFQMDI
jgi:cell division inhibitor SepF